MNENNAISQQVLAKIAEYLRLEQEGHNGEQELPDLPAELLQALEAVGPAALARALAAIKTQKEEAKR